MANLPTIFSSRFPQLSSFEDLFKPAFGQLSFDEVFEDLLHDWNAINGAAGYPPYNVVKVSDAESVIEIAVAGFKKDDVKVEQKDQLIRVYSSKQDEESKDARDYIYRGLATRAFSLTFRVGKRDEVTDVKFEDGLLKLTIKREPAPEAEWKRLEVK